MKFLLVALIVAAAIVFFGCIQVSPPENCSQVSIEEQPGCVYYSAVMNQDPYTCYALKNESQRTVCLKDAIDPSAKKAITKKNTVSSSGSLTNRTSGLKNPSANPAPAPAGNLGTLGTLGNNTQPEENATVPVKKTGGLQNPA
ncbi:MAG: hypothetical protein NTV88_05405 [Candidatus Micrarchaeota archaeon]|nr:hypothetical protein [Candidatus Micrarchaeota archaeon]